MTTVVLLAAGLGSRMGRYADIINKTLLPVQGKAIISHVIEQFSKDTKFVVAVGYKADQVKSYIGAAHPNINVTFVDVDNYSGVLAGPAYSLRACRDYIEDDFMVVACDALYGNLPSLISDDDAVAVSKVSFDDSPAYCNLDIKNGYVHHVQDKVRSSYGYAFNGAFYINNTEKFWCGLKGQELSSGFKNLKMRAVEIQWTDLGTYDRYRKEVVKPSEFDFSKDDEFLYFIDDRVVKWFRDERTSVNRIAKATMHSHLFPAVRYHGSGFYSYKKIDGVTLYEAVTPEIFKQFIQWCWANIWAHQSSLSKEDLEKFYFDKTNQRLAQFRQKYPNFRPRKINGVFVEYDIDEALNLLDWPILLNATPKRARFMHGDLQLANVIYNDGTFKLIDWRQDFAGKIDAGDILYDAAKLKASLLLDYEAICRGEFTFVDDHSEIRYTIPDNTKYLEMVEILDKHFSKYVTDQLVSLIYLNMAALHASPFDKLLYSLALKRLNESTINYTELCRNCDGKLDCSNMIKSKI